ncbi:MAG: putative solute-binding protein [Moraxellaceae bacterium]
MWRQSLVLAASLFLPASFLSAPVYAAQGMELPRICVFDPAGKKGDLFDLAHEYLKAAGPLQFRSYVDERIAVEDFKAGQCDGVVVSTFRARQFNPFIGSVDAFGGLAETRSLKALFSVLNRPQLQPNMVQGDYEVAGMLPLGALYVLVRDRRINSIGAAAGRKVAVLDWDKSQARLVEGLAAQPVAADVTSYAARFNNGEVDIMAAPAVLFERFEVQKGLGSRGAVYRFPLAQLTATLLIRSDRFPSGFASRMRAHAPDFVDTALARINAAEAALPARYWQVFAEPEQQRYQQLLTTAREQLTRDGIYDERMMALLHRVRCMEQPGNAECVIGRR